MYCDDRQNFLRSCSGCHEDCIAHYDEQWRELRASQL